MSTTSDGGLAIPHVDSTSEADKLRVELQQQRAHSLKLADEVSRLREELAAERLRAEASPSFSETAGGMAGLVAALHHATGELETTLQAHRAYQPPRVVPAEPPPPPPPP
eukprot:Sspe_Gene.100306::Locus_75017_Transcript_1_1_Confidence_1.000_Length_371::g.100306::m.100306